MTTLKKQILCIDDNHDKCELFSTILKDYEVTSAYSKAGALKHATAEKYDLYLLDYHLPDGTGLELCLLLRTYDRDTPILFVTATSSITEAQVIIAGGQGLIWSNNRLFIDDLLTKVSQLLKA